MKEQIQQLIANGQTEEALAQLAQKHGDAVLLQGRFSNGKKQYNMGLIEFSEWQRVQAQINYAALELANSVAPPDPGVSSPINRTNPTPFQQTQEPPKPNGQRKPVTFISYNHEDSAVAYQVRDYLDQNGVEVLIDNDDMGAGTSIMEFIQESVKNADAVLSIVSAKSLQSGWVGQESIASMYAMWLADKKFIPVRLDSVAFDVDFQISAQEAILAKYKELEVKIRKLKKLQADPRAAEDDRNRLFELKNNLGVILQRLKGVLMLDISGANFTGNMKKVLDKINQIR